MFKQLSENLGTLTQYPYNLFLVNLHDTINVKYATDRVFSMLLFTTFALLAVVVTPFGLLRYIPIKTEQCRMVAEQCRLDCSSLSVNPNDTRVCKCICLAFHRMITENPMSVIPVIAPD